MPPLDCSGEQAWTDAAQAADDAGREPRLDPGRSPPPCVGAPAMRSPLRRGTRRRRRAGSHGTAVGASCSAASPTRCPPGRARAVVAHRTLTAPRRRRRRTCRRSRRRAMRFADRLEAGRALPPGSAPTPPDDVVVLGLPRAACRSRPKWRERSRRRSTCCWSASSAPRAAELAIGAIAEDGVALVNETSCASSASAATPSIAHRRERLELERRCAPTAAIARPWRSPGRTVIVVDDGLATGASMEAACRAVAARGAAASSSPCRSRRARPAIACAPSRMRWSPSRRRRRSTRSAPGTPTSRRPTDERGRRRPSLRPTRSTR